MSVESELKEKLNGSLGNDIVVDSVLILAKAVDDLRADVDRLKKGYLKPEGEKDA